MDCPNRWLRDQDIRQSAKRQCSRSRSWSRKSCGCGTPDWRVIPAGCEGCRKEISSERIGAPGIVNCFGGAPGTVDCSGGASGKALSLFSLEFSTYDRDTALEECEDGFECGHHVGWFRVERSGAACTLVVAYVSIRLSKSQ